MSLTYGKKFEDGQFVRSARGFLASIPQTQDFEAPAVPSAGTVIGLGASIGSRGCICGEVQRAYLISCGFELKSDHTYLAEVYNNALNSSLDTYVDAVRASGASGTYENTWVPLKLDVAPTLLSAWLENAAIVAPRAIAGGYSPTLVPSIVQRSTEGGKAANNRYDFHTRKITVCKSNELTLRNMPAYGSVKITINNGAPVIVNAEGNGDAVYNFGAVLFPCTAMLEVYKGANATGNKIGKVYIPDACGGDVFTNSRAQLTLSPFDPKKSITRCELWLDPLTLAGADGSAVNQWNDSAGGARHFVKASWTAAPLLRTALLAKSCVDFTGQILFNNAPELMTTNQTVVIVLQHRTEATPHGYISQTVSGNNGWNLNNNGGLGVLALFPGYSPMAGGAENTVSCVMIELDAIGNRVRAFINSGALPVIDRVYDILPYITATTALGAFYADAATLYGALYGSALIGEVMIYSKKLRDADRIALFAYLKAKWGNAW